METPGTLEAVPIGSLTPHPGNARQGNVDVIAESLVTLGQYRPIVAQTGTRRILAGHHVWKAMRRLRRRRIVVAWVACDDATAARIMLADNRDADRADWDRGSLAALLRTLPDLVGTGFDPADIDDLLGDAPINPAPAPPAAATAPADRPPLDLGGIRLTLDPDVFAAWTDSMSDGRSRAGTIRHLRSSLNIPDRPSTPRRAASPTLPDAWTPIDSLHPHPDNPRQGDIGAICESLTVFGQYRPIVVDQDNVILVGHHVWAAASALGWDRVWTVTVTADQVHALKILVGDNRASDLATYDDDLLMELLAQLDLTGTGWSLDDVNDVATDVTAGRASRRPARTRSVRHRIGDWSWRIPSDLHIGWCDTLGDDPHATIAARLDLPDGWEPYDAASLPR